MLCLLALEKMINRPLRQLMIAACCHHVDDLLPGGRARKHHDMMICGQDVSAARRLRNLIDGLWD